MKFKFFILCILLVLSSSVLIACGEVDEEKRMRDEGRVCVTLDCSGGKIGKYTERRLFVFPGDKIARPGNSTLEAPVRLGYYADEWYKAAEDEDGNVITDKDGEAVLGEMWDFDSDRMPDHDFTLYLTWEETFYFTFLYGDNFAEEYSVAIPRYKGTGADISESPRLSDYTIINCYFNADFTQKIDFATDPLVHPRSSETKEQKIYCKSVKGIFTLVRTASDLTGIKRDTNYYLLADIDFSGNTAFTMTDLYSGIIDGGYNEEEQRYHTISGIALTVTNTPLNYGIFGTLDGATIRNVIFTNCSVTVTIGRVSVFNIGLLSGRAINGTKFENLTLNGALTINMVSAEATVRKGAACGLNDGTSTLTGVNDSGVTII